MLHKPRCWNYSEPPPEEPGAKELGLLGNVCVAVGKRHGHNTSLPACGTMTHSGVMCAV